MEQMRTPFFIVALVIMVIILAMELGISAVLSRLDMGGTNAVGSVTDAVADSLQYFPEDMRSQMEEVLGDEDAASELNNFDASNLKGYGVKYLVLIDGILFFTVALIGVAMIIPDNVQGKVQGVVTLVFSVLVILAAIPMILTAFAAVIGMIVLLLAIPFGTLVYLAKFGSFDRSTASAVLSVMMFLKFGFAACLILAQQRFLQGKGLVLIVITSLIAIVVVTFLHGVVPGILVSISDGIAGIVVAILAVIWAIVLLIGSLPAILKAVMPK